MMIFRRIKRFGVLLCVWLMLGVQLAPAQAAMVGNAQLLHQAQQQVTRERVINFLDRADVQQQLVNLGVDPADARARVARMSDSEIAQLSANMDQQPAGGDSIVGIVLLLFIIFIITDMLGATDIFPFVKNINK